MKILKELFSKSSLSRPPQRCENVCLRQTRKLRLLPLALQAGGANLALASNTPTHLEGAKSLRHILLFLLRRVLKFNYAGSFHRFRGPPSSRRKAKWCVQATLIVQRILLKFIILHTKRNNLFESICTRNRVLANFFNKIFLFDV